MGVIDVDPELLRRTADAAVHSGVEGINHVNAEKQDGLEILLNSVAAQGPYAYTGAYEIMTAPPAERMTMKMPLLTTRQELEDGYEELHKHRTVVTYLPLNEIRGAWYSFQEGETESLNKDNGQVDRGVGLVLFPVNKDKGITGELLTGPRRNVRNPSTDDEKLELRRRVIRQHDRYLDALRAADVDAILDTLHAEAQSAIRDYVKDTGTLTVLGGPEEHRSFYQLLFDKYEIRSVDLLYRVTQWWYAFAEVRMKVRTGGEDFQFHTAEMWVPADDDRFIDRVGHGTDPALAPAEASEPSPGPFQFT
jgi:hypothetical protein